MESGRRKGRLGMIGNLLGIQLVLTFASLFGRVTAPEFHLTFHIPRSCGRSKIRVSEKDRRGICYPHPQEYERAGEEKVINKKHSLLGFQLRYVLGRKTNRLTSRESDAEGKAVPTEMIYESRIRMAHIAARE